MSHYHPMIATIKNFFGSFFHWMIGLTIIGSVVCTSTGIIYHYVNFKVLLIQIGCLGIIVMGMFFISFSRVAFCIKNSRIVQSVLVFTGISLLAAIIGLDPTLSFFGHFERGTGVLLLFLIVVASLCATVIAHQRGRVRTMILYPLAAAGGILGILSWIGVTGFDVSPWVILGKSSGGGATLGNSSFAGTILIVTFFITAYLAATATNLKEKLIWMGTAFFVVINPLLITLPVFHPLGGTSLGFIGDARGATISLLMGIGVSIALWCTYSLKNWLRTAGRVLLGALGMGILVGVALLVIPTTPVHDSFVKNSGGARFIYWDMAISQIKEQPLLGTGPETFRYAHEKFFDPRLITMGEPWADKPHNNYLEVALGTGLVGFIAYMSIFWYLGKSIWRSSNKPGNKSFVVFSAGLLAAYMVNNIILFDTMTSTFFFFLIVMWIAAHTEWNTLPDSDHDVSYKEYIIKIVVACAITIPMVLLIRGEIISLRSAWKELFAQPPARAQLYSKGTQASPYGAGISFAQRAAGYGQSYLDSVTVSKEVALQDIEEIDRVLLRVMVTYPPNMQSYSALGSLCLAHLLISGVNDPVWVKQLNLAGQGIQVLSPQNPTGDYFLSQAKLFER